MELPECEKCGACCRSLIIEIEELDVVREPKLLEAAELMKGAEGQPDEECYREYMLAAGRACPMLTGNRCGIYPTRPNVCVAFEAGGEQCDMARGFWGLKPLRSEKEVVTEHGCGLIE